MSVMDLFRTAPKPPAPTNQPNPTTPTDPNAVAGNLSLPGPNTPGSDGTIPALPKTATGDQNPMGKYADLWAPPKEGEVVPGAVTLPNYTPDPTKLREAIKGKDFLQGLSPEVMTKVQAGDGASMVTAISHAVSNAVEMMTHVSAGMTQNAVADVHKLYKDTVLPDLLKRNDVNQQLADNPIFTNPATAPLVEGMKAQFLAKYPNASTAEISRMANEYVKDFAGIVMNQNGMTVTKTAVPGKDGAPAEQDWNKFFA